MYAFRYSFCDFFDCFLFWSLSNSRRRECHVHRSRTLHYDNCIHCWAARDAWAVTVFLLSIFSFSQFVLSLCCPYQSFRTVVLWQQHRVAATVCMWVYIIVILSANYAINIRDCLTLKNGTDRLSRYVVKELPFLGVSSALCVERLMVR